MHTPHRIIGKQGLSHYFLNGDSLDVDTVKKLGDLINLPPMKKRDFSRGNYHSAFDIIVIDPPYEKENLYIESIPEPTKGQVLIVFYDPVRCGIANAAAYLKGWYHQFEFTWDLVSSIRAYKNQPLRGHKSCSVWYSDKQMKWNISKSMSRNGELGYLRSIESIANTSLEAGQGKPQQWLQAIFSSVKISDHANLLDKFSGKWHSSLRAADAVSINSFSIEIDNTVSIDDISL